MGLYFDDDAYNFILKIMLACDTSTGNCLNERTSSAFNAIPRILVAFTSEKMGSIDVVDYYEVMEEF
eukprot:5132481-Ditylum_brightwellii.AAC.1